MPAKRDGVLIVQISLGPKKVEELRSRLSKMECVGEVEFSYLRGKLRVTHDGSKECELKVRRVIEEYQRVPVRA
jgi:hypothetical protein